MQGLLALGNVISALSDTERRPGRHVPYRYGCTCSQLQALCALRLRPSPSLLMLFIYHCPVFPMQRTSFEASIQCWQAHLKCWVAHEAFLLSCCD